MVTASVGKASEGNAAVGKPSPGKPSLGKAFLDNIRRMPLRWRLLGVVLTLAVVSVGLTMSVSSVLVNRYLITQKVDELHVYADKSEQLINTQYNLYQLGQRLMPTGFTMRLLTEDGLPYRKFGEAATETATVDIPRLPITDSRVATQEPFILGSEAGNTKWVAIAQAIEGSDGEGVLVLAIPLTDLEKTVAQFRWYAFLIGLGVIGLCGLLGYFLVRRAFRPLGRIESTAAEIARGDLSSRVEVGRANDEVASLGTSLNAMLGTIEQSFRRQEESEERMRRFVADASHELRTPLAAVTGYAELYRQGALPNDEAVANAMGRIEGEGNRMRGLVEDLLTLARLDEETPLALGAVDLAVVAADAAQDARTIDPSRRVTVVGLSGPLAPTMLVADERRIRQVVANLLSNARSHTPEGTPVELLVGQARRGTVALAVRDHGPGIAEAERTAVFERFYRSDKARTRVRGGNGLGLAIVAAIVGGHGGEVRAEETPGGGATIVVELPVRATATLAGSDLDAAHELTAQSKVAHGAR